MARLGAVWLLLLAACSTPPSMTACLTRADCPGAEVCIAGRCLPSETDAALDATPDTGGDAAATEDAASDDAPGADALEPGDDAGVEPTDASVEPTDAGDVPTDAPPLVGDTCADPIGLVLDGRGHAHAEGVFAGYAADYAIDCGLPGARDVVFEVVFPDGVYDIEITSEGDVDIDTVQAFSETCAADGEFYTCQDDRAPGVGEPRMILHRYAGHHVFVLVRAYSMPLEGAFLLDVDVRPVADTSTCATTIDITGGALVVAWNATTTLAPPASCATGEAARSDVYRLRRAGDAAIAEFSAYFGDGQGSISLVETCTDPVGEAFCRLSSYRTDHYGFSEDGLPFQGADEGFLVIGTPLAGSSYAFNYYP